MVTRHIGLGATVSTSFSEPFHVARAFASLDHLSGGRAGWNVVTSTNNAAALNFSRERLHEHDLRYEIATEFVDVVRGLWDTWDDGAMVADRSTGTFLDKSKVRPLDHKGRFFTVKGPLNIERCPQGHPIIIQAGGSPPGQELSARSADLVFSVVNGDEASAKAAYDSLKQRVIKHGRPPEHVPILPGVMPIIGETDEQAKEQFGRCRAGSPRPTRSPWCRSGWATTSRAIRSTARSPTFRRPTAARPFQDAVGDGAARKDDLRDLYNVTAAARGHWVIYGTPKRIADIFEEWFAADGATASSSCRPISRAHSTTSSIWWCQSCSGAACSGPTTRARRCATTWGCDARSNGARPCRRLEPSRRYHSTLMLAALTIGHHFSISALW